MDRHLNHQSSDEVEYLPPKKERKKERKKEKNKERRKERRKERKKERLEKKIFEPHKKERQSFQKTCTSLVLWNK